MAVYKRTYKAYRGPLTPGWSRFMVLSRYGFATLFDSRLFTGYTVLCMVPFLVGISIIYFVHSSTAQAIFRTSFGQGQVEGLITNRWFMIFLAVEAWMSFFLTAWAAPGMVSKDFANSSIQLYLSRPLSRAEYILGKVSVLGVLLSCTTWIPALLLFLLHAGMQGHGWLWDNLWMAGAIILSGLIGIALVTLLSMALAVWVKWRIAATGLMLATFFVLPGFGAAVNLILRTPMGSLLNLPYMIVLVWTRLFRLPWHLQGGRFGIVPLWSAWAMLLFVCAFSVWLLHRKLKAREVERS